MWSLKELTSETERRMVAMGAGEWDDGEILITGYKLPVIRWIG